VVQKALADSHRIKPGVNRKEVERYFKYDGGLQFPNKSRYTYPACAYIKLEVAFQLATSTSGEIMSPDDTVIRVSKLYIDYPVKD